MTLHSFFRFQRCLIATAMMVVLTLSASAQSTTVTKRVKEAINKGIAYLHKVQEDDGSWGRYPATTALSVSALLRNGKTETNDPAVAKGIKYLLRNVKDTGGIYTTANPALALPNYNTALSVMALLQTKNPTYRPTIQKALKFLEKSQFDEGEGIDPANPMYGGIGYGDNPGDESRPDLSNLHMALEALTEGGTPKTAPVFKKALTFLQRVQNRAESNDQVWVNEGPKDGGFVYTSQGRTFAPQGKHASYGAMTYAGLKSYIYAGVNKNDPRAKAALDWIRSNYSVEIHPGMGDETSLFYYYHTMAKTMDVYGQKVILDTKGVKHDWATDLANALVKTQKPDGSWFNDIAAHWENRPGLVTCYSLLSLSYCLKSLPK